MPDLFIEISDAHGRPVPEASVGWVLIRSGVPDETEESAEDVPASTRKRIRAPNSGEFDVIFHRPQAPILRVRLNLGLGPDAAKFVRGRPSMMTLHSERVQGAQHSLYVLRATWENVEEVVLVAGADTHASEPEHPRDPDERFVRIALRRFRAMGSSRPAPQRGIIRVNRSCMLTLVQFDNNVGRSAFHYLLPGQGTRDVPGAGNGRSRGCVLMYSIAFSNISITDLYAYLALVGRERPGTIRALEFLSHAYWIGPALENTGRRDNFCNEGCPTDRTHKSQVDSYLNLNIFEQVSFTGDIEYQGRINLTVPCTINEPSGHVRDDNDADPRNTDFIDTITPPQVLDRIKQSLSDDAQLRIWGCSVEDIGRRMRAAATAASRGGNVLIRERSYWNRIPQYWSIRAEDARLLYLSIMRRCYGQSLATALDRPCYTAPLGAGSLYTYTPQLRGMQIQESLGRPLVSLLRSLPGFGEPDEAGYYRLEPDPPKYVANVKILITGFAPFNGSRFNCSSEAVLKIGNLRNGIQVPPWIDLNLDQHKMPGVSVIWSSHLGRDAQPIDGGAGILAEAQILNADIVVLVGEDNSLAPEEVRIEYYARNPNDSYPLSEGIPFPGEPSLLKSTVPPYAWAKAVFDVREMRIQNQEPTQPRVLCPSPVSAGDYICNESYYQLLREALATSRGSGRWVSFVHVPAFSARMLSPERDAGERDARSAFFALVLERICQTFVEEMLWARVPHGREATSNLRGRSLQTPTSAGPVLTVSP